MKILDFILSISFVLAGSSGNSLFAFEYISQAGQDKWAIEEVFNFKKNGFFIEIGAADGLFFSNTYVLEKHLDWKGICIEANPVSFKNLIKNRDSINVNACLDYTNHEVDFVYSETPYEGLFSGIVDQDTDNKIINPPFTLKMQTKTLEQVLDECNAPNVIDFLSIDVEGAEHRIFRDFPFHKYKFLALVIERPIAELNRQLQENGYVFVKNFYFYNHPLDAYYVHSSIVNFDNILKEPFYQM